MDFCTNCSGAILPTNIAMGWGGAICYCPRPLTCISQYQPWKELKIIEIEYWKMRRIEQGQEIDKIEKQLEASHKREQILRAALEKYGDAKVKFFDALDEKQTSILIYHAVKALKEADGVK